MTANSLLQLSRIDKDNVKRKDLIVVSPEKTETHVIIKMPIALYENLKGVDDGNA